MKRSISVSATSKNCANNLHNSHNSGKKWKMTYFDKNTRNMLTSVVGSDIISKLSLIRQYIQKKSMDKNGMGCDSQVLKKLLEARKKLLTKMNACDILIWLSLETATKKNKKVVDKRLNI